MGNGEHGRPGRGSTRPAANSSAVELATTRHLVRVRADDEGVVGRARGGRDPKKSRQLMSNVKAQQTEIDLVLP
jgi:hypothetical protein